MKRQLKDDENETKTKQARPVNSSVDLDTINSEMCKEFDELRKKHEEYSIMIKEKEMIIKEKELMIKEKDMMIKEKDMIIEEIDKLLLWNTLLSSLNSFIFKNLSTIVKSSLGLLGKQWVINSLTLPQFIESTGISLLDPLSESMWRQFCQNVAIVQDEAISERKEVHPVVLQVINNIILSLSDACSWQYSARGEHTDVDDEPIEKMPDISIKLANCKSWAMSDIVIPVKIKSNGNILDAMRQSLGYLAVKLRDQLELSQTRNSKLFGYCVGTDGHKICIGTIIIENYDLRVLSFDLDAIPFWEPDMK